MCGVWFWNGPGFTVITDPTLLDRSFVVPTLLYTGCSQDFPPVPIAGTSGLVSCNLGPSDSPLNSTIKVLFVLRLDGRSHLPVERLE